MSIKKLGIVLILIMCLAGVVNASSYGLTLDHIDLNGFVDFVTFTGQLEDNGVPLKGQYVNLNINYSGGVLTGDHAITNENGLYKIVFPSKFLIGKNGLKASTFIYENESGLKIESNVKNFII